MKILHKYNHYKIEGLPDSPQYIGFTDNLVSGDDPTVDIPAFFGHSKILPGVAWMKQVHGAENIIIDKPGRYVCDGIFTECEDLVLVVRTADCLPITLYSHDDGVVGVVHMGWKSAKEGILENIPYALASFIAIAGVGMRKCCYEVGEEFQEFARFKSFISKENGKLYFDPIAFARANLIRLGLKKENFYDLDICSYCSPQNFYSNRKTGTKDRTLSFIKK